MSDLDLIRACAESNDEAAWEEFVSRYRRPIALAIRRTAQQWGDASGQTVDDLVQDTFLKLCAAGCRRLLAFANLHPDSISKYIRTVAINLTHDHFRSDHSQRRGSGKAGESLHEIEPFTEGASDGSPAHMERAVLLREISHRLEDCLLKSDRERDRVIFWFYYRQGMTACAIADLPEVRLSEKGVESAILRLTRCLRQRVLEKPNETGEKTRPGEKGSVRQNRTD
jgi:RNA polymerase sigma-70 factor (ECF subfamily)